MPSTKPNVFSTNNPHLHIAGEVCPLCDQPIPTDKLVEIQQRERARALRQETKLRESLEKEKLAALAEKTAEIELIKQQATDAAAAELVASKKREAMVRAEVVAETERSKKEFVEKAVAEKKAVEEQLRAQQTLAKESAALVVSKNAEIETVKKDSASAVALEKAESKKREEKIKVDAASQVEAAMTVKLTKAENEKTAAEEKAKALAANMELEKKLAQEQMNTAVNEAKKLAQSSSQKELAAQRESLEKASTAALQKEQSSAFLERQKLEVQLENVQRQLKNKTADELGEAAEFDLFDELKKSFSGDVYNPIGKGSAGADLWQDVMHNGIKCGRIIYDSKNRESWRNDYVSKLKTDQLNAEGDHAVLTTRKFPAGVSQLHVQDGVIVSHPARVIAIVSMLREQIIHVHRLNASNSLRDVKTEELYKFINSERCNQMFDNFLTLTENLFELDVAEKKSHDKIWKKRGEMIAQAKRTIQIQLRGEIDRIIVDDLPN